MLDILRETVTRHNLETRSVGTTRGVIIYRLVTLDDERGLVNGFDIKNNHRFTGLRGHSGLFKSHPSGPFFYTRMPVTREEAGTEARSSYFQNKPVFMRLGQEYGMDTDEILRKVLDPGDAIEEGGLGAVILMHLLPEDITGLFLHRMSLVEKTGMLEREYTAIQDITDIYQYGYNDSSRLPEVTISMRNIPPEPLAAMESRVQVGIFKRGDTSLNLETYKKYLEKFNIVHPERVEG